MQFADNLTAYMETAGDSICNKEVMWKKHDSNYPKDKNNGKDS
jgi:hypothetical protein